MSSESVGAIIALLILLLLVGGGVWFFVARRRKERARIEAMSTEERELHDATIEYSATLKTAEKLLRDHQKTRDAQLKSAHAGVANAHAIGSRTVGSYRGRDGYVVATESVLTFNGQAFYLEPSVRARVDTAGNLATSSRSTVTRVAAGGLLFGPVGAVVGAVAKKNSTIDTRELYLLVESDTFSGVVTCKPDDGPRVRQLAATINNAARNVPQMKIHRQQMIEQAAQHLQLTEAETGPLDEAVVYLAWARSNTKRQETAAVAVEAAHARLAIEPPKAEAS